MSLFIDVRVCTFCIYNVFIVLASVSYDNAHSLATAKGNHIYEFINLLFLLKFKLNEVFGSFDKAIPDGMGVVNETNLVRTRSLKLVFMLVFDYIMAYDKSQPKIIEMRISSIFFKVILKIISFYDIILQGNLLEDHFIGC